MTCATPHNYNQRAYFEWNFANLSSNGGQITVDGQTYTMVSSVDNTAPNQVLIGNSTTDSADNLIHAVNDDGVGKGGLYSSLTTAHPTVQATVYTHYVQFYYWMAGPAGIGTQGTSAGAGGSFDTPKMRMQWTVNIYGGTGGWTGIGTNQTPKTWLAQYVSPTSFALYSTPQKPYDSSGNGPYDGQQVMIRHASGDGTSYPYAYRGESWSLSAMVTPGPSPYFAVNVPGCPNLAHESECAMAYRDPEVQKYPGVYQKITSFTVQGGVGAITLTGNFPYTKGDSRNLKAGSLVWVRNVADPAGTWTHTSTYDIGAGGTIPNHLVKFIPGSNLVGSLQNHDMGGVIGVCTAGCGSSGTATIADAGLVTCTFDNTATAGDFVIVNGYDDRCRDYGPRYPDAPVIGIVQDSGPAGDHQVWWAGLNRAFVAQSVNGPGDGTGVTQVTVNVPGYPDGTYPSAPLPGYAGTYVPPSSAFLGTNYTVSPYVTFLSRSNIGYDYFFGLTQSMARNQATFSPPKANRIEFWVQWGKNQAICNSETGSEVGTYVVPPGFTNLFSHFYHGFDSPTYAGQWVKYVWTPSIMHQEGVTDTAFNYPADAGLKGYPFYWRGPRAYFDELATFYMDLKGLSCAPNVTGQTLMISPLTYEAAAYEPEELILFRGGVWSARRFQAQDSPTTPSGTPGYDLFWAGPKAYKVQYEVRYSTTGSLKLLGFSNGLCKNGTTTCGSEDRVSTSGAASQVYYQSASMPRAPDIWWGIKPVSVPVIGATGGDQNPTWLITPVDLGLSGAGDRVAVTDVGGNSGANYTGPTSAVLSWQTWMHSDPTVQSKSGLLYPANSGGPVKISLNGHGYATGQTVQLYGATPSALNGQYSVTVIDGGNFTLDGSSYDGSCSPSCSGGTVRLNTAAALSSIVADGAGQCTVNLSVDHQIFPGWKIYVFGSANKQLNPSLPAPTVYTVTSTPASNSFVFACPKVSAGTYTADADNGGTFFGVQSFPGVAIPVVGNGTYTNGGTIQSLEDNKNFAELEIPRQIDVNTGDPSRRRRNGATTGQAVFRPQVRQTPGTAAASPRSDGNAPNPAVTGIFRNGQWLVDRPGDGSMNALGVEETRELAPPQPGDIPVIGDWNGDGRTKAGIFRNGQWLLDFVGDGQVKSLQTEAAPGGVPVVGDWNGDGRTKVGVYRDGLWLLDYEGDGRMKSIQYTSTPGAIPVVGDWNGDGRTKTGVYRDGQFLLDYYGDGAVNPGNPSPRQVMSYAGSHGIPVVGDWNGDGRTKTGVFQNGTWLLDYEGDGRMKSVHYETIIGGIPVVGDWNGDGRTKTGIFRPGLWVLDYNGDGTVNISNPGSGRVLSYAASPNDRPMAGKWIAPKR